VGTIARLDPVKDLGTLIAAVAALNRERPAILVMVGDGPDRANLEGAAANHGVGDRVRWLGQRNDARDWLAGCDAYANTSISEGVSLTILEAMAAALPVVATAVGGTPEVIDERSGVLVAPRDPMAVSAALLALAASPARRHDLGIAARERVESHFSLDRMVREYRNIYSRLS
jgi:glycosyltransferase involved in cell wall biosynthesis